MDFLKELNQEQREAAGMADGAALITAGPGTGKTRTLAARICYLVKTKGVDASNILALTFTKSAAKEMQERVRSHLDGQDQGIWIETFHAACVKILKEENYPFGPGAEWTLADDEEKEKLLAGRLKSREIKNFLEALRLAKQNLEPLKDPAALQYQERLLTLKRLDYDDLLYYAHQLFKERPETLGRWRARFHHILVDEFQDTSLAQYSVLKLLSGANVCAVGDPDQAIYGFSLQGFSPFEEFRKDFPSHRVFPLTQNYRCQGSIVQAAVQVIGKNASEWRQELRAKLEKGLPLEISEHATESQEAEMIVRKIESLLGGSSHFTQESGWAQKQDENGQFSFADIAIFYRFHAQARRLVEVLERSGLPFRVWGKKETTQDLEDFQNGESAQGEGITLMTLHRSKGLEFPVVFIAGCEEGLLPSSFGKEISTEEERRLFYVGMTRAKNLLFLSYSSKRTLFGKPLPGKPSPFLADIEEELKRLEEFQPLKKKRPERDNQPLLFPV